MKIALFGYGKMGKAVEAAALAQRHTICAIIDPKLPTPVPLSKLLADADVCIDFTRPDQVLNNLKKTSEMGKNMIIGTTGWYDHLDQAKALVEKQQIGCLYSPNFSLGIALFIKILTHAADLITPFNSYDVGGIEIHNKQKLDAPSGTAQKIAEELSEHMPSKKNPIPFSSLRVGTVPGTHSILFNSPWDTITLTHTAHNREGFAVGAIEAAEWIIGKKGLFTMDDLLQK